jgi:diacylglycerol kinase (ATP)
MISAYGDRPIAVRSRPVRVLVLVNPSSGRRRASQAAVEFMATLRSTGHDVRTLDIPLDPSRAQDGFAWAGPDGLGVVIAGDGTINRALPLAVASATPLYHVPCGNENLFAHELGMDRDPRTLVRALAAPRIRAIDLGELSAPASSPRLFSIMLSLGPDAGVIRRLDAAPRLLRGKAAYVLPILREFVRPSLPRLRVWIDGTPWLDANRGVLVIANMRRYALGIDPARGARPDDARLDVAFIPGRSSPALTLAMLRLGLDARAHPGSVPGARLVRSATASAIRVESLDAPAPVQADGESVEPARTLQVSLRPAALRVLMPSSASDADPPAAS